jgi:hypothetical protein
MIFIDLGDPYGVPQTPSCTLRPTRVPQTPSFTLRPTPEAS